MMKTFNLKPVFCLVTVSLLAVGCDRETSVTQNLANDSMSNRNVSVNSTRSDSAISHIKADEGFTAKGLINFRQEEEGLRIFGEVTGLTPGKHGFHIHEFGDCSAPDGKSAGGHFSPNQNPHGSPHVNVNQRHAGDLGNITADPSGRASVDILNAELTVEQGQKAVVGKSVIVHAGNDDMSSQPSGDAGARVGCGLITATTADS